MRSFIPLHHVRRDFAFRTLARFFAVAVSPILTQNTIYSMARRHSTHTCRALRSSVPLPHMRRRHFLTLSAATLGGVLVYSLDRKASLLSAQHKPVRIPLRFLTETEALIVAAAASRIFPSDDSGPG